MWSWTPPIPVKELFRFPDSKDISQLWSFPYLGSFASFAYTVYDISGGSPGHICEIPRDNLC